MNNIELLDCTPQRSLTKIMYKRLERKIEDKLSEDQFRFRKNMSTKEAILALRLIVEKRIRKDKSTFISFVDIEKAFDYVNWEIMFKIMKRAAIAITYQLSPVANKDKLSLT